jgi:hypothetical protein
VPQDALKSTEYRFLSFGDTRKAASTNPPNSVFINIDGPFVKKETTLYFPNSNPQLHTPCQVNFVTTANMRALILLHELGHEIGNFPADLFGFINGRHTLQVLSSCFKELKCE